MKEVRERIPSTRGELGLTSPQQESEKKIKTISYLYLGKERFSVTLVQWIHTWTGLCGVFFKLCNFSAVGSDSQVWRGGTPSGPRRADLPDAHRPCRCGDAGGRVRASRRRAWHVQAGEALFLLRLEHTWTWRGPQKPEPLSLLSYQSIHAPHTASHGSPGTGV